MLLTLVLCLVSLGLSQAMTRRAGKKTPEYFMEKYSTKDGDVVSAVNGNGIQCSDTQTRLSSALGLAALEKKVKDGAEVTGTCIKRSRGKRQTQCSGKTLGTCDSGDQRVESLYKSWVDEATQMRYVVANGIPNHCYHTDQLRPNPNGACENFAYIYAPAKININPSNMNYKLTPMGPVGIAVSGAFLYNHKSAETCNVAAIQEKESFDTCDGHADGGCRYHYHKAPICITKWDTCGLMGYLLDGIPVYGECTITENGASKRLKSCYHLAAGALGCDADNDYYWKTDSSCHLDEANGYYFQQDTPTDNPNVAFKQGDYAYFVTPEYPFLMPKYAGRKNYLCGLSKN